MPYPGSTPAAQAEDDFLREAAAEDFEERRAFKVLTGIFASIIVVVLIAGASIWYLFVRTPAIEVPTAEPAVQPNLVTVDEGGVIVSPYGAEVHVPPGAVSKNVQIEIVRVSVGASTDRFHFAPSGLKFSKPVTVIIPYKGEPDKIRLLYWFSNRAGKQELPYTVDAALKVLTAEVTEL